MTSPHETYSRKGFLKTGAFAAVVSGVSLLVATITAPEQVTCSREGAAVNCELTRILGGRVPVKRVALQDVRSIVIQSTTERSGIGQPRSEGRASYRLQFVSPERVAFTVQTDPGEVRDLRTAVEDLRSGSGASAVRVTLAGTPRFHPWALAGLVFGLSIVPLWVLGYFFPWLRPNARRRAA